MGNKSISDGDTKLESDSEAEEISSKSKSIVESGSSDDEPLIKKTAKKAKDSESDSDEPLVYKTSKKMISDDSEDESMDNKLKVNKKKQNISKNSEGKKKTALKVESDSEDEPLLKKKTKLKQKNDTKSVDKIISKEKTKSKKNMKK